MPDGNVQDSRDPNSPQWGYIKVNDPGQNQYPARDKDWNNYVMFVYDNQKIKSDKKINKDDKKPIPKEDVDFIMVPATLTIKEADLPKDYKKQEGDIRIPSSTSTPVDTTLWVALVTGKKVK